jgi:hypothetical protein
LRESASQRLIAETVADGNEKVERLLGAMDGSGYGEPDPPTAPLPIPALSIDPSADALPRPAW